MQDLKNDHGRIGILLINLGTPEATDFWSMRRYLAEFLSDPRVIELSPWIWKPILHAIILNRRPRASGRNYDKIWNTARDESPLKTITRSQADMLQKHFDGQDADVVVDWAMRYGKPSIASRLERLQAEACGRILMFPLYPQYSASTTASVHDKTAQAMAALRHQPALRWVPPYYGDPLYVGALAQSLKRHLATLSWTPDCVLASFHGVPQSYIARGDPYQAQCEASLAALRARLGWDDRQLRIAYQSRFGRAEWIRPYADETVRDLARSGGKSLCMITPGFAADCLETLEEVAIGLRDVFLGEGGERFSAVACLNDGEPGMAMLAALATRELRGWL